MVAGIEALKEAGCNIIVDDITFTDEPKFEDGLIAQAARGFYNSGGIYVTSAGNSAQWHYSSTYNRGDNVTMTFPNKPSKVCYFHDYGGGDIGNTVTVPIGGKIMPILQWNDQWGSSGNDFDLFLINSDNGSILAKSTNLQDGNDNPWEGVYWLNPSDPSKPEYTGAPVEVYVAVLEYNLVSDPSSIKLDYNAYYRSGLQYVVPQDSVIGHQAVTEVLSTAAAPAASPDTIESFSSRGPATIYFPSQPPRQLPNITGVDGVQTKTGQLGWFVNPFYGTSAAAPHVAAIAALVWSANLSLSQLGVFNAITTNAVERGAPGWDGTWGFGLADAYAAVASALLPTVTSVSPDNGNVGTAPTVTIIGTNFVDGQTTINVSGAGVTAGAVTFTSSSNISAPFTIDADAAAGPRQVTVTVAGKTSNAVSFTVNAFITVTAPSSISLGLMTAGAATAGSSTDDGTVDTNYPSWVVTAEDKKVGTNDGYMVNGGETPLTNIFQISKDNNNWVNADSGITYGSVTSLPFYVRQAVTQSDPGGSYTITITFTGSPQ